MQIVKHSPWGTAAMVGFALSILVDLIGLLLLFLGVNSLHGMNLLTATGQIQSAANVLGITVIALILGSVLNGAGLFCLAAHTNCAKEGNVN